MYVNFPDLHRDAIDCLELFSEPQVIYLCLSSATEPTNAPGNCETLPVGLFQRC